MLKRSHSASVQFNTPSSFLLLFFVFQRLFLFSASIFSAPPCFFSAPPPFVSFLPAFLFFSVHVCPFFQPKNIFFSPKRFSVQPTPLFQTLFVLFQPFFFLLVLFSAHLFFLFSASFSSFFFSASFSFLQTCCPLFFSPKYIFSPKRFSALLQPKILLVQPLFSSVRASFSVSCQLPRPKIFSLDASHFFYLNKSLFSSNLE